jgi:hypothetical protein
MPDIFPDGVRPIVSDCICLLDSTIRKQRKLGIVKLVLSRMNERGRQLMGWMAP